VDFLRFSHIQFDVQPISGADAQPRYPTVEMQAPRQFSPVEVVIQRAIQGNPRPALVQRLAIFCPADIRDRAIEAESCRLVSGLINSAPARI